MRKAIVIGSGAGGSFAAMELAGAGWQVMVFEKGPNHFTNLAGQGRSARCSPTTAWP